MSHAAPSSSRVPELCRHRLQAVVRRLLRIAWLLLLPTAQAAGPLQLHPGAGALPTWNAITVLSDPSRTLTVQDVLGRLDAFAAPARTGGSLGVHQDAMWLRIPLAVPETPIEPWVVALDYSSLLEVDFYLVQDGRVLRQALLGYARPPTAVSLASRTPQMRLPDMQAGQRYDVLVRVRTLGPMILPIQVSEWSARAHAAQREQLLQGLLHGIALSLLFYSLLRWVVQREKLFGYYALLVLGSVMLSVQLFGIGAQFLWSGHAWPERHFGLIGGLVALAGSFLFLGNALAPGGRSRYARCMRAGGVLMSAAAIAFALDLISVRTATLVVNLFGMAPSLASLPMALRRRREGDPIGGILLVGWSIWATATATFLCLIQGWVPANFWTLHSLQFGSTLDMLIFLRVLGLRSETLRRAANAALVERDRLRSQAHTDPLTGLPNRRGLQLVLEPALAQCASTRLTALYLMDLDGFKPVNDRYGHDTGDELLAAVAQRLRATVRPRDTVARLGGDEFIVLAPGMHRTDEAADLGQALLGAFREPFTLRQHRIQVGITIGYALAPLDGTAATDLMAQADAAMYRGKQAGKHTLHRAAAVPAGPPAPA